ncbi:MAG TPA: SDR family oxidoreductase [Polyangiaceae bacterium]|jgi:NAD(P)-dependent dehydrogenase (short-subunit alcohol dehydrogenase family)|nr:SDR family oxidoreductase [Polyangiaceae bacterium]
MKKDLEGRVVVVTGATAGVGRATVRAFAERGAALGLIARGRDGLEATRAEIEELGRRAVAVSCDVADADGMESAADAIERELGPIDIWVNNAMASVFAPISDTTAAEFRRVTEVTYFGTVHGTMAALRRMKPRDRGTIVQVGSALAHRSIPLQAAYCGAKHGIHGFTESLRTELLHDGSAVHVTEVVMPALNTPQFDWSRTKLPHAPQPVPPIYQPEVAADAIVFAALHHRRQVWVAWSVTKAVVGEKLASAYADRYLGRHGYEDQESDELAGPSRPDNLYSPLPGDRGARGRFDDRARAFSIELWVSKHRAALLSLAAVACVASGAALGLRRPL